jgi:hypothetical protein
MNEIAAGADFETVEVLDTARTIRRSLSPTGIKIILPVWGSRFVRQFLEFALPTLLAPGNVPALAKALPCQFVLLTSGQDDPVIRHDRGWRRLRQLCRADIELIDDLITEGNHTTTLTLAYARAIKQAGEQMMNTCFFLLVSDYIMADGSLSHVLERMQRGVSGILAGNFQIIAEDAIPMMRRKLSSIAPELVLPPRNLMQWTFNHLHPATSASIVNYPLNHKSHTNRLFWRVDDDTLIGHFYLLHPIAVRPEVTDFVIGSSFDYSFIPEMCPSDNVEAITNSDDYLVVEMQSRAHEADQVRWGPLEPKNLAKTLSEWTTAEHRKNIQYTFIYHASDIPKDILVTENQADQFINRVSRCLSPAAQPHRNHHYWSGAVAAHYIRTGQELTAEHWRSLIRGLAGERWRDRFVFYWRIALFGPWPNVRPWHPRWPDFRPVLRELRREIRPNDALLILGSDPVRFASWLASSPYKATARETARLLNLPRHQYMLLVGKFDGCLMLLREGDLNSIDDIFKRVGPLLKPGGQLLISISNDQPTDPKNFTNSLAFHSGRLANLSLWLKEIRYVPTDRLRWKLRRLLASLGVYANNCPIQVLPFVALVGVGLATLSSFLNLLSLRTSSDPRDRLYSSVFMVFNTTTNAPPFPDFGDGSAGKQSAQDMRSTVEMARYQFVKNLVANCANVGEYGCDNGLGTELVVSELKKLTVYDRDPAVVDDLRDRNRRQWGLDAHVHDILRNRLPARHDAIFSLRALEQVNPEDEDRFVRNLKDSLVSGGILIVGSEAPQLFDAGNCETTALPRRSGPMFKALMARHFDAVFLFSLIGETIFADDIPGAQYFLALCRSTNEKAATDRHSHDAEAT